MIIRFLLFSLLFLFTAHMAVAETLSVNADNVNLRSGPGTTYAVTWEYGKGFPLNIVKRKGEWVKVSDFEKDTGWIHSSLLANNPHVIVKVNKNSKKNINIRSGPSTKNSIVGKAFYGVVFERLGEKSGWINVRHESGLEGWIKGTLLWGN